MLRAFDPDVVHLAGVSGATAAARIGVPAVAIFQTDVAGFARRYGFRGTDPIVWSWLRRIHSQAIHEGLAAMLAIHGAGN